MNIYISGLSYGTTDADLNELFSEYGQISSAKIISDRETGRSRGFGFVEMEYGIYRINCPLLKVLTGKELTDAEAKALLQKYGFKTE